MGLGPKEGPLGLPGPVSHLAAGAGNGGGRRGEARAVNGQSWRPHGLCYGFWGSNDEL